MPVYNQNDIFAGRYVLSQLVGEGGFSEVWKAQDQMADGAVVAIKIYAPDKGLDDYGVRQFRKEFSLTFHLSHPHLMKVNHFDITDGSPYLIMPFCAFGSLARTLAEEGGFNERQMALVMCQIGSALEELHKQDPPILHQDIKPDNILVYQPESFLLADFGISSQVRHTLRKATSSLKSLTVAYAPPERFDRHPTSDTSSDIFSFGVTLYEMCTNRIPWDGSGGQSLLKGAHIPHLPESFSAELNNLLQECMAVDRSKRPSAAELHIRGRNFLETGQWKLPRKRKNVQRSSNRRAVPLFAAALAAILFLGGFWGYNSFYLDSNPHSVTKTVGATVVNEQESEEQPEDQLKILKTQVNEAEKRIVLQDSINKTQSKNKEPEIAKSSGREKEQKPDKPTPKKESQAVSASDKDSSGVPKSLQEYLNQVSNPKISKKNRLEWKQEIIKQFADNSVVFDEKEGGRIEDYPASAFLNILLNAPHYVIVKEVKRDKNSKIKELRLSSHSN